MSLMKIIARTIALIAAVLLSAGASAQGKFGQPPQAGVPGADAKPLAERKDVVSWKLLAQVELVKVKDRYQPQFSSGVAALDAKEVKVQGFMMPLEMGDKQSHFILSATPQSCNFCMPGGPEALPLGSPLVAGIVSSSNGKITVACPLPSRRVCPEKGACLN